jgi:hypothetical protein
MNLLLQNIHPGEVYRRSDLEYYSTAIDRHLAQLTEDGILVKVNHGLYYAPKKSKFGVVPPDDHQLVERFLKDDDFLLVSPNAYNALGLGLTQLYNTTWVYNHKRKGEFQLNGKTFELKLKSSFPKEITNEFLLVDLLNNSQNLAEDFSQTIEKLKNLNELNISYNQFNGLISYALAKKDTFQMTMLNDKGVAVRLPLLTDNTGVVGTPD